MTIICQKCNSHEQYKGAGGKKIVRAAQMNLHFFMAVIRDTALQILCAFQFKWLFHFYIIWLARE